MAKGKLTDQDNATIYQYKLIKRYPIKSELVTSYMIMIAIFGAVQILVYGNTGLFSWLLGFAAVQMLHLIILLITFIQIDEATDKQWKWRILPPWIGIMPANYISLIIFRRVHRHLFWLGLCVIGILYPWVHPSMMISLVSWHLWLITPRLFLSFSLRKQKKSGLLRLQTKETSYYHS